MNTTNTVLLLQRKTDGNFLCYDHGISCIQEPYVFHSIDFRNAFHVHANISLWPPEVKYIFDKEHHVIIRLKIEYYFLDSLEKILPSKKDNYTEEMADIYEAKEKDLFIKNQQDIEKLKREFLQGLE